MTLTNMDICYLIIGALLILVGREMFWLGVGVGGFLWGMGYGVSCLAEASGTVVLIFGVLCGLLGAALAAGFEWLMVMTLGFYAGGWFFIHVFSETLTKIMPVPMIFVAGGLLGVLAAIFVFDWVLIGFSTLVGAALILWSLHVDPFLQALIFVGILAVGVLVQTAGMERLQKKSGAGTH